MNLPQIVYLQTLTACNGHCRYCPFDDVYGDGPVRKMSLDDYLTVLHWLRENNYQGRIGFLLHYEPTLDVRLADWTQYARAIVPGCRLEVATNGLIASHILGHFDVVDRTPPGTKHYPTSRAGNCRACPEISGRIRMCEPPCRLPLDTMCIAANGDVLLCCQDWRHEAIVGTVEDLTAARASQLKQWERVKRLELEICRDCMAGRTAEEVGGRLGRRAI